MPSAHYLLVVLAVVAAYLVGVLSERARARFARHRWRARQVARGATVHPFVPRAAAPAAEAKAGAQAAPPAPPRPQPGSPPARG
jgi:hypothetical protein